MGRYIWGKFRKLLCLIFIIWFICRKLGIDLIDWVGIKDMMIAAVPSILTLAAIIYVISSVFKK